MSDQPCDILSKLITEAVSEKSNGPLLVALDGRSGVGKSTLAAAVAERLRECSVIEGDQFYAGGTPVQWDQRSATDKADCVIDWRRQQPILKALRSGTAATWHAFDWDAFDGRLSTTKTICLPTDVVILEGAYSARPELAALFDLRILLITDLDTRLSRLSKREGDLARDEWSVRWDEAEHRYFSTLMPPEAFDLIIPS